MRNTVLLLLLMCASFATLAANFPATEKISNMKEIRKAPMIAAAMQILAQRTPRIDIDPADFEISAWASKFEMMVKFRRILRYLPLGKSFEYDLSVNLTMNTVDPFDSLFYRPEIKPFYMPTPSDRKSIALAMRGVLINPHGYAYTVTEEAGQFHVQVDLFNEFRNRAALTASSSYRVDKKTGVATAPLDLNSIPSPGPQIEAVADDRDLKEVRE